MYDTFGLPPPPRSSKQEVMLAKGIKVGRKPLNFKSVLFLVAKALRFESVLSMIEIVILERGKLIMNGFFFFNTIIDAV